VCASDPYDEYLHPASCKQPGSPVKAFCVGRVYRREAIDPTHLAEFEQLEGVVMDEGVTFGNLLGILREFYHRMGFEGYGSSHRTIPTPSQVSMLRCS